MSTIVRKKIYEQASEDLHTAILADVIDEGFRDFGRFGEKDCVKLVFFIGDELSSKGEALQVSDSCPKTLGAKSKLSSYLRVFTGLQVFPDEINVADYIGANCRLNIVHNRKDDGRVFANVKGVFPPEKGAPKLVIPPEYSRAARRDAAEPPAPAVDLGRRPVQSAPAPAPGDAGLTANIARVRKGHTPFNTGLAEETAPLD